MSRNRTVFICGAGISGLTLAYRLLLHGRRVVLLEMAQQAGGRCRSYEDKRLGLRLDNGNHLLLGANRNVLALLHDLQVEERFVRKDRLHFMSVTENRCWQVGARAASPLLASIPGLSRWRRVRACWQMLRSPEPSLPDAIRSYQPLRKRLLVPVLESIFNTPLQDIATQAVRDMIGPVRQAGSWPFATYVPKQDWGHALIEPLLERIEALGGDIRYGQAVRSLDIQAGALRGFQADTHYDLAQGDAFVLAVAARGVAKLLPEQNSLTDHRAIINVHFRTERVLPQPILGLTDGITHWVFQKPGHVSVTISAADHLLQRDEEALIQHIWQEVCKAGEWRGAKMPDYRLLIEKNASFAATPEQWQTRPCQQAGIAGLYLAGDYTATGLPGSIESAVVSANTAADMIAG